MCVHTLKHSVERRGEFPKLNIVVFVEKHRRDHRVNGRHQKEHNERVCNRQNRLQQRCMCCVYVLCVCVVCTCCMVVTKNSKTNAFAIGRIDCSSDVSARAGLRGRWPHIVTYARMRHLRIDPAALDVHGPAHVVAAHVRAYMFRHGMCGVRLPRLSK